MRDENVDFPIDGLADSLDKVLDSLFEPKKEEKTPERSYFVYSEKRTFLNALELLPRDKVIAKIKCYLKDEDIFVEVDVLFNVESIDDGRVVLSSPNFIFTWRCLKKGSEVLLLSKDGNYLLIGEVEDVDLSRERVVLKLKGNPIKYSRQLFRVVVNPKKPIYLVMRVGKEPLVAPVYDINEEACSFVYKPLPILPGDIFGVVLRFPDGKKILIPDSEVITVRNKDKNHKIYVLKLRVPEKERLYLRRFLIERQREILSKLKEGYA